MWSLTFMVGGKKRVERIPEEWVDQIRLFPELAKQHGGSLDDDELDLLLGGNAVRLYKLEPPTTTR